VNWTHYAPAVLASFLASFVEFVEALTIVLAVGVTRGWVSAFGGASAGALILAILVVLLGPSLHTFPVHILQIAIGVLLLLFGTRWLRKAVLRAAGVLDLRDEEKVFTRQREALGKHTNTGATLDGVAFVTSLKAVFIEGLEVVFVVIAVGAAGGMILPASIGALGAGLVVVSLGVLLHKPLSRVPENNLKFAVGVLLSAFGVFWVGEGLGYQWFGEDWSIVALITGFLTVSLVMVRVGQRRSAAVMTPR